MAAQFTDDDFLIGRLTFSTSGLEGLRFCWLTDPSFGSNEDTVRIQEVCRQWGQKQQLEYVLPWGNSTESIENDPVIVDLPMKDGILPLQDNIL